MEISWYGHSCFRISERGRITVVTDPYSEEIGLPELKQLKGDVVTISHDVLGHNNRAAVKGEPYILSGPGEYEIGNVFISGFSMHDPNAESPIENVVYLFEYDNLTVLHLGDLAHVPEQSLIEAMPAVNVLLVPVGGGKGLNANQAADVVALIEPHYVVPMHYALPGLVFEMDSADKFLKAMGVSKVNEADVLKITGNDLPEQTQVVMLTQQTS